MLQCSFKKSLSGRFSTRVIARNCTRKPQKVQLTVIAKNCGPTGKLSAGTSRTTEFIYWFLDNAESIGRGLFVIRALRPRDEARLTHRGSSTVHTTQGRFTRAAFSTTRLVASV